MDWHWPSLAVGYVAAWMTGPVLLCLTMALGYVIGRVRKPAKLPPTDPSVDIWRDMGEPEVPDPDPAFQDAMRFAADLGAAHIRIEGKRYLLPKERQK